MENNNLYKIIGIATYTGISKSNKKPYTMKTLEIEFNETPAQVKTFSDAPVQIGDYARIGLGIKKNTIRHRTGSISRRNRTCCQRGISERNR